MSTEIPSHPRGAAYSPGWGSWPGSWPWCATDSTSPHPGYTYALGERPPVFGWRARGERVGVSSPAPISADSSTPRHRHPRAERSCSGCWFAPVGWCPPSLAGLDSPSARRPRANDHHWEVAMLGHEDERRLAAIEQQLLRDDADFVRRLTRRHLVVTRSTWRRLGAACSGCLCALATVVVLLAGSGRAHPALPRDDGCGRVHVPSRPASPPPAPLATCLGRGAGGDRRTPS